MVESGLEIGQRCKALSFSSLVLLQKGFRVQKVRIHQTRIEHPDPKMEVLGCHECWRCLDLSQVLSEPLCCRADALEIVESFHEPDAKAALPLSASLQSGSPA